jgi:guanylate kinase
MSNQKEKLVEKAEPEVKIVKPGKPQVKTVYTHGKKFVIPIEKDVAEFLKEKFPKG